MPSALPRRSLPVAAVALMAAVGLPSALASVAGAGGGDPLRPRLAGALIPGTNTEAAPAPAAVTGLPSRPDQIKVLEAVLAKMKRNFARYALYAPGPADIFDYNIGALWRRGIDGAGTTIAVLEGWRYLDIYRQVARFDKVFGLPNPQIRTIYPAGPDPVWQTRNALAEGAGYSSVFTRPAYQNGVASITRSPMRSVPDLTMDARVGTSEAAPLPAGVLALATQVNKGDVGPINPVLYRAIGPRGARAGIADVVTGNNSVIAPDGTTVVPGFSAARGFDVASGWGTINAARFVPSLAAATAADNQDQVIRAQARAELAGLRHGARLSVSHIRPGGTSYLLAPNFLPGHPVALAIDGRAVATLTANTLGDVTYMIDPSLLKLPPGKHAITLSGMLLTETAHFTTT